MLLPPVRDTYGEEGDERKGGAQSIFISPQPTTLCSGWWLGKIRTTPRCSTGVVCIKHFMTTFNVENRFKIRRKNRPLLLLRLFMLPAVVCQFIPQVDAPLSSAVCYLKTTFTFIFLWGAVFERWSHLTSACVWQLLGIFFCPQGHIHHLGIFGFDIHVKKI